ncbi:DUF4181 domain-containing protein [Sporosarcina sp. PTS2304]|uniref:DUF4181 domain-containing protein n=1 Tax=Sporosarcina sp. PTS2304 TaxID=2283194 RepID=UPI0013B36D81|nr:DUF4181 domain-containing protein [Sporosarcina sp. PTS2304]
MDYYGIEPYFWTKLFIVVIGLVIVITTFEIIMRKLLSLKRMKFFSNEQILNPFHRKLDWMIRIFFIFMMIIGGIINVYRSPADRFIVLEPYVVLFFLTYTTESVTAYMQWKYAEDKNEMVLTLSRLGLLSILLFVLYLTDFFGLF